MRCITLGSLIAAAVCLGAAIALSGGNNSPVGTWQVSISGTDRGVTFLTFSNDFTFAGYGITRDTGSFTIAGTWEFDSKDRIVSGYTQFIEGGSAAGILRGDVVGNGRLQARARTTQGPQKFKAPPPAASPDLAGAWAGKSSAPGERGLTSFTLAASTNNTPGWFDLSGTGINSSGSFSMSGAVLVTSDHRVGAYTVSDFGTATQTASFAGRLVKKGKKLVLVGMNDDRQHTRLLAERP